MSGLERRIEKLEQQSAGLEDAELLAFGATVTDAELLESSKVAKLEGKRPRAARGGAAKLAVQCSDADLWRIVRPDIERYRRTNEGPKR